MGLGLAYAAWRVLVVMAPTGLTRLNETSVGARVLLFALAVSVAASLFLGSVVVFKCAGLGIRLREGGRSTSESRERRRSRGRLVVVQMALALVLLVSS